MLGLIAFIVVLVALVASVGNVGYLALLKSAADKKGAAGTAVSQDVRRRMPVAGATAAGAGLALLFSLGSGFVDVLAILIGGGAAYVAGQALSATRKRYGSAD